MVERGRYLGRPIVSGGQANCAIREAIVERRGLAAARIGSTELDGLRFFVRYREGPFPENGLLDILSHLYLYSGVFPQAETTYGRFCETLLGDLEQVNLMGVWFNRGEAAIVRAYARGAILTRLRFLEPYYHSTPWSAALEGKTVLVVSPFASSIESQYRRRHAVWRTHPDVLPSFSLATIKAPQYDHLVKSPFADWVEALEALKSQVAAVPFDVLIVGAGAWGLPLAVFAKELGKVGIHLGGATQVLFGIKGRRWENHPVIANLINEAWVRPSAEETPRGNERIEGGCYW